MLTMVDYLFDFLIFFQMELVNQQLSQLFYLFLNFHSSRSTVSADLFRAIFLKLLRISCFVHHFK